MQRAPGAPGTGPHVPTRLTQAHTPSTRRLKGGPAAASRADEDTEARGMGHPRPCSWRLAEKGSGSGRATLVPVISRHGPSPPSRETGGAAQHPAGRCRRPENTHAGSEQGCGGRGSAELRGRGLGQRGGRHRGSGKKDQQARTNCAAPSGGQQPWGHKHAQGRGRTTQSSWPRSGALGGACPAGHTAHKDSTKTSAAPSGTGDASRQGSGPSLSFQGRAQVVPRPAQVIQETAGAACSRSKGRSRGRRCAQAGGVTGWQGGQRFQRDSLGERGKTVASGHDQAPGKRSEREGRTIQVHHAIRPAAARSLGKASSTCHGRRSPEGARGSEGQRTNVRVLGCACASAPARGDTWAQELRVCGSARACVCEHVCVSACVSACMNAHVSPHPARRQARWAAAVRDGARDRGQRLPSTGPRAQAQLTREGERAALCQTPAKGSFFLQTSDVIHLGTPKLHSKTPERPSSRERSLETEQQAAGVSALTGLPRRGPSTLLRCRPGGPRVAVLS